MIQIIPNWHPVFVHFTVALLSLAVIFPLVDKVLNNARLKEQLQIMARWNLWLGTGFGIVTALAGWDAYNTVEHDAASHAAMTLHLYWALATLAVFVMLSSWSIWRTYTNRKNGALFTVLLLAGGALLLSTAWHGGELVYRYGLGVMSLPQSAPAGDGHDHEHVQAVITAQPGNPENQAAAPLPKPVKLPANVRAVKPHNADGHTH